MAMSFDYFVDPEKVKKKIKEINRPITSVSAEMHGEKGSGWLCQALARGSMLSCEGRDLERILNCSHDDIAPDNMADVRIVKETTDEECHDRAHLIVTKLERDLAFSERDGYLRDISRKLDLIMKEFDIKEGK